MNKENNTTAPCRDCPYETEPKNNSVCEKDCQARSMYAEYGEWQEGSRPIIGIMPTPGYVKKNKRKPFGIVPELLKITGHKTMRDLLIDYYYSSKSMQDVADKLTKLTGIDVTYQHINYHMSKHGLEIKY